VAADVADEKVSPAAARELYGVVIDDTGALDEQSTKALRAARGTE
jgi:N-methylhydantoinase B